MNMKKKIVTVCLVACMALTAVAGGTLAYFTDTKEKTNTFTVGDLNIKLEENANWNNEEYKPVLFPGQPIEKDPVITVEAGSQPAYVFAEIELGEGMATIMKAHAENAPAITEEILGTWFENFNSGEKVTIEGNKIVVSYGVKNANDTINVFGDVTVPETLTKEMQKDATGAATVKITAKAIQAEGFDGEGEGGAEAAYEALTTQETANKGE